MLGVAITILAFERENPEAILAQGPVLEIARNVVKALEELDGRTVLKLRSKRRRKKMA